MDKLIGILGMALRMAGFGYSIYRSYAKMTPGAPVTGDPAR